MKPVSVKNEDGDTIEISWDADGNIQIRHSAIDRERFGQLHEYSKRLRHPGLKRRLAEQGLDVPEAKALVEKLGGYMMLGSEQFSISAGDISLILEAVKLNGGILPNWSAP
jgi:YD repeat-containing protein